MDRKWCACKRQYPFAHHYRTDLGCPLDGPVEHPPLRERLVRQQAVSDWLESLCSSDVEPDWNEMARAMTGDPQATGRVEDHGDNMMTFKVTCRIPMPRQSERGQSDG